MFWGAGQKHCSEILLDLPDYEISEIQLKSGEVRISAWYVLRQFGEQVN